MKIANALNSVPIQSASIIA